MKRICGNLDLVKVASSDPPLSFLANFSIGVFDCLEFTIRNLYQTGKRSKATANRARQYFCGFILNIVLNFSPCVLEDCPDLNLCNKT